MTARCVAGVLAVAGLLLAGAGCGTREGQRLIEYERGGDRIQEKKVRDAGRYTLHARDHEQVTYRVEKGERVGFRRGREGFTEAFAGDNPAVELDRRSAAGAYWELDRKTDK